MKPNSATLTQLSDVRSIVDTFGRDTICAALNTSPQGISNCLREGRFHATWKKVLDDLAEANGVSLSWEAFKYRKGQAPQSRVS